MQNVNLTTVKHYFDFGYKQRSYNVRETPKSWRRQNTWSGP